MTQQFFWTPPGSVIEYPLNPPSIIPQVGREGFDGIPATLYDCKAPYQHGASPLGGSFEPRELVFPFVIMADSLEAMAVLRRAITRLFAPTIGIGLLRWVQDDGVSWTIKAEVSEGPVFQQGTPYDGFRLPCSVVLQAKDPFWYEASATTAEATLFTGGWTLGDNPGAWSFPWEFGLRTGILTCTNAGDVATPCTLTLTGPATAPCFENMTTGDVWRCRQPLLAGEQLIVSSVFGHKTAIRFDPVTGASHNAFATIRTGSEWIELIPGDNLIAFTGSEASASATLKVEWYNRYLGA